MKLQCENKVIKNAVSAAQLASSKQSGLAILAAVHITAQKERGLIIRATNISVGIEVTIAAHIEEEGECLIDGSLLLGIVQSISDQQMLTIETGETLCTVSSETTKSTIKLFAKEDFPTLPVVESENPYMIPAGRFILGVKSVVYAASPSEIKPEISSVFMFAKDEKLTFVSTDSFRLAEKKIAIPGINDFDGIMVPAKNMNLIMRMLSEEKGSLEMKMQATQISFKTKGMYITSRLVDGSYPDYERIIPSDPTLTITALMGDVQNSFKTLRVFADRFHQVDMTLDSPDGDESKKQCTLISHHNDLGQATSALPCLIQGNTEDDMHIRFNGRYLSDGLNGIYADSIRIDVVSPQKPLVISGIGQDDFRYLIMTMSRS